MNVATLTVALDELRRAADSADRDVRMTASALARVALAEDVVRATIDGVGAWRVAEERTPDVLTRDAEDWLGLVFGVDGSRYHPYGHAAGAAARAADLLGGTVEYDATLVAEARATSAEGPF